MNAFPRDFDATELIKHLQDALCAPFQVDWVPSVRFGSTFSVSSVVVCLVGMGRRSKIKRQIVKIVCDEEGSVTVIPFPSAIPNEVNPITNALLDF